MSKSKYAAILGVYGKPSDRFMACGYRDRKFTTEDLITLAGKQGIVQGIEMTEGPDDLINLSNHKEVQAALNHYGLKLCSLNPNLWGELQWAKGTIGAADAKVRRLAIDRIKSSMDLAAEMGCDTVGIWPGQDGFDYLFQVNYQRVYEWWVQGIQECADHLPQIKLGLEYKPYEPRTHSFLSTNAKTLLLLKDVQRENVGVVFDVGHSLFAHESLGEVVALSQQRNKLFHIHLNDNYADWDWDMNFGSVHILDFIEMIYWLKRTHYEGWYSVDIFPYRTDGPESVGESILWLQALEDLVDSTNLNKLGELIEQDDPISVSRTLRELVIHHR